MEKVNELCDGFVCVPMVMSMKTTGLLVRLKRSVSYSNLSLSFNEGYLSLALHTLRWLCWTEPHPRETSSNSNSSEAQGGLTCGLTLGFSEVERFTNGFQMEEKLVSDLLQPPVNYFLGDYSGSPLLHKHLITLREMIMRSDSASSSVRDWLVCVCGFFGAAVFSQLSLFRSPPVSSSQASEELKGELSAMRAEQREEVLLLLDLLRLLERRTRAEETTRTPEADWELTPSGKMLFSRLPHLALSTSYRPLLAQLEELLIGSPQRVFTRTAESQEEGHIIRSLNLSASAFLHQRYFECLSEEICSVFNRSEKDQPDYVMDVGCGDGTLLAKLYNDVKRQSTRGQVLDQRPLVMIGVDFNPEALSIAEKNLKGQGIPHLLLLGDIAAPAQIADDLRKKYSVSMDNVLHVRTFLDHDRSFVVNTKEQELMDRIQYVTTESIHVDEKGGRIPPESSLLSLVQHLYRWSSVVKR
eukprot:TRINITY_DN8356_c0_g1_i1.p2 TRINITY_DN8356_c0_g1~~TRINITY_DN8356_c0_g1_i1.p2  ORF type:complete len:470 (-),score=80.70 TRINITY_DN8356_c0_g1_i1:732-2141(-)